MAIVTRSLVDRFHAAGLTVVEMPGWMNRGECDGPFSIRGVLLHHDGMGLGNNNVPSYMSQDGVDGAQLWIKKDGSVFTLAAGRKWHAGLGSGWGSIPPNHGNDGLLGIETDHTFGQDWTAAQMASIVTVTQCAVAEYGIDVDQWVCGHKEYASGRKPDPENFDLNAWRSAVKGAAPSPIPAPAPPPVVPKLEDSMFHIYWLVGSAGLWFACPGSFEKIDEPACHEYADVLVGHGGAYAQVNVGQRELDVLMDAYRRWPAPKA